MIASAHPALKLLMLVNCACAVTGSGCPLIGLRLMVSPSCVWIKKKLLRICCCCNGVFSKCRPWNLGAARVSDRLDFVITREHCRRTCKGYKLLYHSCTRLPNFLLKWACLILTDHAIEKKQHSKKPHQVSEQTGFSLCWYLLKFCMTIDIRHIKG